MNGITKNFGYQVFLIYFSNLELKYAPVRMLNKLHYMDLIVIKIGTIDLESLHTSITCLES